MEDVKQSSPGVLETLMRRIPGYSGYLDRSSAATRIGCIENSSPRALRL